VSTFSQWWKAWDKDPKPKQFTYVCGTERVLVEEVVDSIVTALAPTPWNLTTMVVGDDAERSIWSEVDQYPLGPGYHVVVIRNAEKLKAWNILERFIASRTTNPKTFVILVSEEEKAPRQEVDRKQVIADHLTMLSARGQIIECSPFTQATAKHAVSWVQSKIDVRSGIAGHLLDRADGDLRLVRDVCVKVRVINAQVTLSTINAMLSERPRDSFSDALLALDKKTALMALERMDPADYSRTIGFLDARLDLAGLVHDMQARGATQGEMMQAAGNKNFLVPEVVPVAKHYDHKRRLRIRRLLAVCDEAIRGGQTDGTLEAVVALW
jgi:DNA polymerase III delta subunit